MKRKRGRDYEGEAADRRRILDEQIAEGQRRRAAGEDWAIEAGSRDWVTVVRELPDEPYSTGEKIELQRAENPIMVVLVADDGATQTTGSRTRIVVPRQKLIDALLQLPKEPR